jgi:hypothetical protein
LFPLKLPVFPKSSTHEKSLPHLRCPVKLILLRGTADRLLSPQSPKGRKEEHFCFPLRGRKAKELFLFACFLRANKKSYLSVLRVSNESLFYRDEWAVKKCSYDDTYFMLSIITGIS